MVKAKAVMPVPNREMTWPNQTRAKERNPIELLFKRFLLHFARLPGRKRSKLVMLCQVRLLLSTETGLDRPKCWELPPGLGAGSPCRS
jgi:hypothetical protein